MRDMTRAEAIKILSECKEKGFKHTFYTLDEYHTAMDIAINSLKIDEQYDLAMETPERLFTKKEIDDAIERIEIAICEEEENTLIALGMANALTILNQKLGIGDKE